MVNMNKMSVDKGEKKCRKWTRKYQLNARTMATKGKSKLFKSMLIKFKFAWLAVVALVVRNTFVAVSVIDWGVWFSLWLFVLLSVCSGWLIAWFMLAICRCLNTFDVFDTFVWLLELFDSLVCTWLKGFDVMWQWIVEWSLMLYELTVFWSLRNWPW